MARSFILMIPGSHGSGSCRSESDVFRTASQGNIRVILTAVSDTNSRSNLKGVRVERVEHNRTKKTLKDPCRLRGTRAPGRLCMAPPCLHLWLAWITRVAWQQTMCHSAAILKLTCFPHFSTCFHIFTFPRCTKCESSCAAMNGIYTVLG